MPDKDFNNHKGINLNDGENLNDAVNLKQLQGTGNYYTAKLIPDSTNIVSINITPIIQLVRGFNFYVFFPSNSGNNGAFTIRVMSGNTFLGNIEVLDKEHTSLEGGEITSKSTRHFVYNPSIGAFILDNGAVINLEDFDFNNHKGKKLADGKALNDAVNLKQLKGTGNYYTASLIPDVPNTVSINIAPITKLVKGFNFYVYFPKNSGNNGAFTVRVMSGDILIDNIQVYDKEHTPLEGGEITEISTRHFVYVTGLTKGPAFILDNGAVTNLEDFNFNEHKGINLSDGENLDDAVNLKQLKKANMYYTDTSNDPNIINLSILPLTELTDGLHVWIQKRLTNTDTVVKIKLIDFQNQPEVLVFDFNGNPLVAGLIVEGSIREFVYVTQNVLQPAFYLINRDTNNLYTDLSLNARRVTSIGDGTALTDAVNLKQLKTANKYYTDNSQTDNIINLSITPLATLTDGLHVWIKVNRINTDPVVKIKMVDLPNQPEFTVLDFNGSPLSAGSITVNSIREFVYIAFDGIRGNHFRLINRDTDSLYKDLDFKIHKGINVAYGTELYDAVNLQQLKQAGNFYIATLIPNTPSIVVIDIAPLPDLITGFSCRIYFPMMNIGPFTIRVMSGQNLIKDVRVVDNNLLPLSYTAINLKSIRSVMYMGYEPDPYFMLDNPSTDSNTFAYTNLSNVDNNIRYVNRAYYGNGSEDINDKFIGLVFNNENIGIQSGIVNVHNVSSCCVDLTYTMATGYFYSSATFSPGCDDKANDIFTNDNRVVVRNTELNKIHLKFNKPYTGYVSWMVMGKVANK